MVYRMGLACRNLLYDDDEDGLQISIEYCTKETFHTKHSAEKYDQYFQAVRDEFLEKFPHAQVEGNPEVKQNGGHSHRPFKMVDHMGPLRGDVLLPRLGAFEVTLTSKRTGSQRVFSKLDTGHWPNPQALVRRAERLLLGQPTVPRGLDHLPPLQWPSPREDTAPLPLPGFRALRVRRNPPLREPRFERNWSPPRPRSPRAVRNLKELSLQLCREATVAERPESSESRRTPEAPASGRQSRNSNGSSDSFARGMRPGRTLVDAQAAEISRLAQEADRSLAPDQGEFAAYSADFAAISIAEEVPPHVLARAVTSGLYEGVASLGNVTPAGARLVLDRTTPTLPRTPTGRQRPAASTSVPAPLASDVEGGTESKAVAVASRFSAPDASPTADVVQQAQSSGGVRAGERRSTGDAGYGFEDDEGGKNEPATEARGTADGYDEEFEGSQQNEEPCGSGLMASAAQDAEDVMRPADRGEAQEAATAHGTGAGGGQLSRTGSVQDDAAMPFHGTAKEALKFLQAAVHPGCLAEQEATEVVPHSQRACTLDVLEAAATLEPAGSVDPPLPAALAPSAAAAVHVAHAAVHSPVAVPAAAVATGAARLAGAAEDAAAVQGGEAPTLQRHCSLDSTQRRAPPSAPSAAEGPSPAQVGTPYGAEGSIDAADEVYGEVFEDQGDVDAESGSIGSDAAEGSPVANKGSGGGALPVYGGGGTDAAGDEEVYGQAFEDEHDEEEGAAFQGHNSDVGNDSLPASEGSEGDVSVEVDEDESAD